MSFLDETSFRANLILGFCVNLTGSTYFRAVLVRVGFRSDVQGANLIGDVPKKWITAIAEAIVACAEVLFSVEPV